MGTDLRLELLTEEANARGNVKLCGLGGRTLIWDRGYCCRARFGRLQRRGAFPPRRDARASGRVAAGGALRRGGSGAGAGVESARGGLAGGLALGAPSRRGLEGIGRETAPTWVASPLRMTKAGVCAPAFAFLGRFSGITPA